MFWRWRLRVRWDKKIKVAWVTSRDLRLLGAMFDMPNFGHCSCDKSLVGGS